MLGNGRPPVLLKLEDCVLQAVVNIAEGREVEDVINDLHSQIQVLSEDLGADCEAMNWFDITIPTADLCVTPFDTSFGAQAFSVSTQPSSQTPLGPLEG